jgi:hypothetical protein
LTLSAEATDAVKDEANCVSVAQFIGVERISLTAFVAEAYATLKRTASDNLRTQEHVGYKQRNQEKPGVLSIVIMFPAREA